MLVLKLLLLLNIRIFCSKMTKFGLKLAFLVILGKAHLVPYWWVGLWLWGAGGISQNTYLLHASNCQAQRLWYEQSMDRIVFLGHDPS